jgi:hypothetical protein
LLVFAPLIFLAEELRKKLYRRRHPWKHSLPRYVILAAYLWYCFCELFKMDFLCLKINILFGRRGWQFSVSHYNIFI